MEQENTRHALANFTRELSPEYIKDKVEKVVSCSSGPDLFCEIFDSKQDSITASELVEWYYPSISGDKNAENDGPGRTRKGTRIELCWAKGVIFSSFGRKN
jgi:hypothetical protein